MGIVRNRKKYIAGFVLFYLAFTCLFTLLWLWKNLPWMDLPTIAFQMKVPLEGTEMGSFAGIILLDTVGSLSAAGAVTALTLLVRRWKQKKHAETEKAVPGKNGRGFLLTSGILFAAALIALLCQLDVFGYLYRQCVKTKIYDDYYVDPAAVELSFPEEKRNLVYIYLESMELSFADAEHGGIAADNYIPKLTELSLAETDFAYGNETELNGVVSTTGTTWTIASLVAQTAGVPLSIPIGRNAMGKGYSSFLPGAHTLGDILQENGYRQMMIMGSDKAFSGMDVYLESHGEYEILDYYRALEEHRLPSDDYKVWWGYEDWYLFQFAKEELLSLAEGDQPFALTLMTMDTHRTDGYLCEHCPDTFGNQYSNVIACSDTQITDFVAWLQEQEFYENTTVVIVGDHPTMDGNYIQKLPDYSESYQRRQYLTILNSAQEYTLTETRKMTPMDLFPTTLAALGVEIPGDRLGLGTNLYTETPTLLEELGLETLNREFEKTSTFYNKRLLYGE